MAGSGYFDVFTQIANATVNFLDEMGILLDKISILSNLGRFPHLTIQDIKSKNQIRLLLIPIDILQGRITAALEMSTLIHSEYLTVFRMDQYHYVILQFLSSILFDARQINNLSSTL
jgi:hypothetical protein